MDPDIYSPDDLNREDTARLVIDFFHRMVVHNAMRFAEVQEQLGRQRSWDILREAYECSYDIQTKRIWESLGFEMENGFPKALMELPREALIAMKESVAKSWQAGDGVWFQAAEFSKDILDAKRCKDSCWSRFSHSEAWFIERFLNLPRNQGLEGLKKALEFRLYAAINRQSILDETPTSFIFQMNECRVQAARKRKGLEDYPCKSGEMAEYSTFAEYFDPEIKTECISCPPDKHPKEWFCAWRFYIDR